MTDGTLEQLKSQIYAQPWSILCDFKIEILNCSSNYHTCVIIDFRINYSTNYGKHSN